MPEDFPQTITSRTQEKFTIGESGIYAIYITARCNGKNDLRVEIDNQFFRETPPKDNIQKFDIPPAWNGTKLKGRSQTNIFLLQLDEGEHVIDFIPEGQAKVEEWTQWRIENPSNIIFSGVRREKKTIVKILDKDIHHLEFWADKTPTLNGVVFDLGELGIEEPNVETDQPQSHVPTVDNPKWTEIILRKKQLFSF